MSNQFQCSTEIKRNALIVAIIMIIIMLFVCSTPPDDVQSRTFYVNTKKGTGKVHYLKAINQKVFILEDQSGNLVSIAVTR